MPFRPGMSATVDINTNTEKNVISIPIQAVTTREKEKGDTTSVEKTGSSSVSANAEIDEIVFVYEADTARMVKVETGIQDNEFHQILSGLETGQEIITGPYSIVSRKLKNGLILERKENKDDEKDKKKEEKD